MRSYRPKHGAVPRPLDAAVAEEVSAALRRDGRISAADQVQVIAEHRIVTLSGVVPTFQEAHAAVELAGAQPGVTAVVNRMTVAMDGQVKERGSDKALQEAVNRRLAALEPPLPETPGARVERGIATLYGHMDAAEDVHRAVHAAGHVHGLRQVISAMTIGTRPPAEISEPIVDDAVIRSRVGAALVEAEAGLMEPRIDVRGGEVHLRGYVVDHAHRLRAVRAAREVPGVRHVVDHLVVRLSRSSPDRDQALAGRVYQALVAEPRVDESRVKVESVGGEVYLTGQVGSIEGWNAAFEAARAVRGVQRVVNLLTIVYGTSAPSDEKRARFRVELRAPQRSWVRRTGGR